MSVIWKITQRHRVSVGTIDLLVNGDHLKSVTIRLNTDVGKTKNGSRSLEFHKIPLLEIKLNDGFWHHNILGWSRDQIGRRVIVSNARTILSIDVNVILFELKLRRVEKRNGAKELIQIPDGNLTLEVFLNHSLTHNVLHRRNSTKNITRLDKNVRADARIVL